LFYFLKGFAVSLINLSQASVEIGKPVSALLAKRAAAV